MAAVVSEAIRASGMSQRAVADKAGLPLVTLNRKLLGSRSFNTLELAAISQTIGVSLVELALRATQRAMGAAA